MLRPFDFAQDGLTQDDELCNEMLDDYPVDFMELAIENYFAGWRLRLLWGHDQMEQRIDKKISTHVGVNEPSNTKLFCGVSFDCPF